MAQTLAKQNEKPDQASLTPGVRESELLCQALERIYPFLSLEQTTRNLKKIHLVAIRLTTHCNQSCPFCQAIEPQKAPGPAAQDLRRAFARLASALPGSKIVFTGGEPTLREDLPALVADLVAREGILFLEVQTNGIRLGANPDRLIFTPSEKLGFMVAMHGLRESIYDACTGTQGQLESAISGVKALLGAGHPVELNCVLSALNIDGLQAMIESIPSLFPDRQPGVHLSIMGVPEQRDATDLHVPYPRLVQEVSSAIEKGADIGLSVNAALNAGHAAVPPCLLTEDLLASSDLRQLYNHEGHSPNKQAARWWTKSKVCASCQADAQCLGLPRSYVEKFGLHELTPIG